MGKNLKELAAYFSADQKRLHFLIPILPIFITQINQTIVCITLAHDTNNDTAFILLIHKLKGTALTFGAQPISTEIKLIEDQLTYTKKIESIDLSQLVSVILYLNKIHPTSTP